MRRGDDPRAISGRILARAGLDREGSPEIAERVDAMVTPIAEGMDGDMPAGGGAFARLALEREYGE